MGSSGGNNDDMSFQSRAKCASSVVSTSPFLTSSWDPVVSLSHHENFGGLSIGYQGEYTNSSFHVGMDTQGISSATQLVHYPSASSFGELLPKFPCFGSGNFSEMVGSFSLASCNPIVNTGCPPNCALNKDGNNEVCMANGAQSREDHQFLEEVATGASPSGKGRKRTAESNSSPDPNKNADGELEKDPSGEISDVPKEQDEKKPKSEQNNGANLRAKQAAKQIKDSSDSGGAPKENYIHVRARRGQATNSHSLAERVRREKISERMKMLQELVPGCNKITGKAVMLDEIINYVQSLQQQVEFLSMKLATVNPELNLDIERLLSKEILHSRGGNASGLGFNLRTNSQPFTHEMFHSRAPVIPNTNSHFPSFTQAVLDHELQSLFQMGFDSSSAIDNLGPNGRLKPEL